MSCVCCFTSALFVFFFAEDDSTRHADVPHHGIRHFAIRITDKDEWESVIEREQIQVEFDSAVDYPHSTSWYVRDPTDYQIEVVHWNADEIRFAA